LEKTGLKKDALSFPDVIAQSIANIAPSATPALIIPLVFVSAGNATWLAYAIATIATLFVAAQINVFAKRSASPGALYTFTTKGLGPRWGAISGWSLLLAYVFTASATVAGFTNYAAVVWESIFQVHVGTFFNLGLIVVNIALCGAIAWRDVKLSTRFMLALEFAATGLIVLLIAAFFARNGHFSDPLQLSLRGTSSEGFRMALVLALFSFVGFESATALGEEARNPLKSIPKSVFLSVVSVGLFFTIAAYTLVYAFRNSGVALDKSTSPLVDLAKFTNLPQLGLPLAIGAMIGQGACGLACISAAARVMYSMGNAGFFHSATKKIHPTHSTPYVAVTISVLIAGIFPLALVAHGSSAMDSFGYLGSFATFGFLLSYVLVSVAAPAYLRKKGELRRRERITALVALLLLAIPIVGSVYPVPEAPYNYLPYLFLLLMLAGTGRVFFLKDSPAAN
jgi:amino acid transporter